MCSLVSHHICIHLNSTYREMSGILILQSHGENFIFLRTFVLGSQTKMKKWTNSKFSFLFENNCLNLLFDFESPEVET
jgi:hypothetical protein